MEVVLVDPLQSADFEQLRRDLVRDGWPTVNVVELGELPGRFSPQRRAVVVVHATVMDEAFAVLDSLESKRHSARVVVVAERAAPGERYCLMEAGALEYFESSEDLESILRGVEWAARALAP
ncbi:MAG: hypothetical protein H6509_14930 [Bryobacterales bacterium]|nr:hypothetical protein [Bryobacterales bacterium]